MTFFHRLKRDFARHRAKASVLGVLFVVMIVMSIKAVLELRPQNAGAIPVAALPLVAGPIGDVPVSHTEADARLKEGGLLWDKLREVKATAAAPAVAFSFDASFYPPPLVQVSDPRPQAAPIEDPKPVPVAPSVDPEAIKVARIHEQARALVVKSTATGSSDTQPVAIINQQLLTVGQVILGFEIVAIHSREVEFRKEGVTVSVNMPNDSGTP